MRPGELSDYDPGSSGTSSKNRTSVLARRQVLPVLLLGLGPSVASGPGRPHDLGSRAHNEHGCRYIPTARYYRFDKRL